MLLVLLTISSLNGRSIMRMSWDILQKGAIWQMVELQGHYGNVLQDAKSWKRSIFLILKSDKCINSQKQEFPPDAGACMQWLKIDSRSCGVIGNMILLLRME